ncbi:MAG: serine hydrolase [Acidimicrobiia bacterium]|nr:serine hydrolase [Acidimicrobiia bacterium]
MSHARQQIEMVMPLFVVGILAVVAAAPLLWWARREHRPVRSGRVAIIVGTGLLVVGMAAVGTAAWALTATDTSQFARTLVWGDSRFGDQDRFPSREMAASAEPVTFEVAADSPVSGYVDPASNASLEQILESTESTAFIVLHGDDLLYEGYLNGSSHESVQTSFSVAKSFVSTLVGIAIEDGFIDNLDEPLTNYIPELADRDIRFGDITLRHLLVMSSGLSFDDGSSPWADPANTYHGTNLRSAAINKPSIESPPGVVFDYNDWDVILLGLVLERATGMPVADYMAARLWQPMGAEADGSWSLDSDRHGFEKVFVGVNGRAIDFAKLGWLYLHDGRNRDRQVVPADFVADATRLDTTTDPAPEYQYLWWIDQDRSSYYAHGDHGQFIYVDPTADLVIVRHGRNGDFEWIQFLGELADWLALQLDSSTFEE